MATYSVTAFDKQLSVQAWLLLWNLLFLVVILALVMSALWNLLPMDVLPFGELTNMLVLSFLLKQVAVMYEPLSNVYPF